MADQRIERLREYLADKLSAADVETACLIAAANIISSSDDLLPDPLVAQRYDVTARTLYRWDDQPKLNFPKPIRINGRKYRSVRDLENWERQRVAATADKRITSQSRHRRAEVTIGQT